MKDLWTKRSMLISKNAYMSVLDPADESGIKNKYIDIYLKHYLMKYLEPIKDDKVLEIGCGFGRLVEYVAPKVGSITGVDIIENFVKFAKANSLYSNTTYFLSEEFLGSILKFNKAYIVWVIMCIESDDDLQLFIKNYAPLVTDKFVLIEQTSKVEYNQHIDGKFYAKYRTTEKIISMFEQEGFKLVRYRHLGHRYYGCFARLFFNRYVYKYLPSITKYFVPIIFLLDRITYSTNRDFDKHVDTIFEFRKSL